MSKQFKSVSEALESANKRMKAEGMEMSDDYNPADRSTYRNRRRRYDDQGFIDGDIFDPSDIAAGDYVDFGAYGNLFVLKAPFDGPLWVTSRRADRYDSNAPGQYIRRRLAKGIIEEA